jgi:hypothetical protein
MRLTKLRGEISNYRAAEGAYFNDGYIALKSLILYSILRLF